MHRDGSVAGALRHATLVALACALAVGGCARRHAESGVQVGRPAPEFALHDLAGHPVSSASLAGTPTVLNFWATWCLPCIGELPVLAAVQRAGTARVVGIAVDEADPEVVRRFVADRHLPYAVLLGDDTTARRYGILGIPFTVVLDRGRSVVAVFAGAVEPGELDAAIRKAAR